MNSKPICVVCGNDFQYRKGKIYCSNSCKTKGFILKKEGVSIGSVNLQYSQGRTTFFLSDYQTMNPEFCSFEQYCFLIKNFDDNEDVEFVNEYADIIVRTNDFETDIRNRHHPMGKQFLKFLELFYEGKYKIKNQRDAE